MRKVTYVSLTARSVLMVIGLVLLVLFAEHLVSLLLTVFIALILAAALGPAVGWFVVRRRWSRLAAVSFVFALALGAIGLVGLSLMPTLLAQVGTLTAELPHYSAQIRATTRWVETALARIPFMPPLDQLTDLASAHAEAWASQSLSLVGKFAGSVFTLVIALITAFFLLLEAPELKQGLIDLMPPFHRRAIAAQLDPISLKLGAYVLGILISMASYGIYLAIGLSLLHVPLALILALVAGLLAIIPLVGGYLGMVPALLMALTVSWQLAVATLVVAYIGNFIVGHFITPFVFARGVEISPLVVMLALIAGGETMGVVGALIAVPVVAAVQVLVKNLIVAPMERRYALEDSQNVRLDEPLSFRVVMPATD